MSKVGAAFGGGKKSGKPSHREILEGLHQAALDKKAAAQIASATASGVGGGAGNASNASFKKGRLAKAARLKRGGSGGVGAGDDTNGNGTAIKRPGLRTARLLGS